MDYMTRNSEPLRESHDIIYLNNTKILGVKKMINYVLCKKLEYKQVTKGGVYIGSIPENDYLANALHRKFEVIKAPDLITIGFGGGNNMWMPDDDLREGDVIWISPFESANCQIIRSVETMEDYYLVHYSYLRAAIRGNKVVTLNGFNLCEPVKETKKFLNYEKDEANKQVYRVLYPAKPNKYYKTTKGMKDLDGGMTFSEGDLIVVNKDSAVIKLEGDLYREFIEDYNKDIYCIQGRYVIAKLDNYEA